MTETANIHADRTGGSRHRTRINPPVVHFSERFKPKCDSPSPFKISELGEKAKARGFLDGNTFQAQVVLGRIGYQHASSYFDLFKTPAGTIEHDASMKKLHRMVIFDRKLQAFLMEYIGLFELQFRAQYSYYMSNERGAFAHRNPKNFKNEKYFKGFLRNYGSEFNRQLKSQNGDVMSAYETYGDAPIWLAVEIMSFGTLSKLFNNTRSKAVRKGVSSTFSAMPEELDSWMRAISSVRNTCAHFGKICGKKLITRPKRIPGNAGDNGNSFYIVLLLLYLLKEVKVFDDDPSLSYGLSMLRDAIQLFTDHEDILKRARIPEDWLKQMLSIYNDIDDVTIAEDFMKRDGAGNVYFEIGLGGGGSVFIEKEGLGRGRSTLS